MAALFLIYFIAIFLIYWRHNYVAFGLVILNLILCLILLFHFATGTLQIRL
ncbi:MAG TPA: hypothetical protein VLF94_05495 [Chlamydiales bacterium]|nr:hypothetical protein [Chlamydiales bacterium]